MKTLKIMSLVTILALAACGGSSHVTTATTAATTSYNLLTDDGVGVIFDATETTKGTPAQIKLYDSTGNNELRMIVKGETFPGSSGSPTYALSYEDSKIVLFGVEYAGATIDEIVCEKSNNPVHQLHFEDHKANDGSGATVDDGIYWTELVDMNGAAIVEDRTIPCSGGGKSFNISVFRDNDVSDSKFTLYFDFVNVKFRGRIVVTEVGKSPSTDGVVLNYK
ncbi:MAG: hypothetical protein WCQ53_02335 [bacterium]